MGAGHIAVVEVAAPSMGDLAIFRPDGMGRVVLQQKPTKPLAIDDKGVYIAGTGGLTRLALDGSGSQLLTSRNARAVAVTSDRVFLLDGATLWTVAR